MQGWGNVSPPAPRTRQGLAQQLIREFGHGHFAGFGLVVENADHEPGELR